MKNAEGLNERRPQAAGFCRGTLLVGLVRPCLIFNVGLVSALLKALLLRRFIELAGLFIHCLPSLVPWIAVSTGWGQKIVCACALSHILTSLVLLGTAYEIIPTVEVIHFLMKNHYESWVAALVSFQYQLSVPVMVVLNGLRVYAWYLISIRFFSVPPWTAALVRTGDWLILMTVHIGYELKNWYMHNHTPTHNTPQPHPQRAQPKVETPCLQADSPTSTQSCVSPDLPMGSGPVGVKDQPFHEEDLGLPWDSGSLDRRVRLASLIPEAREPYRRKPESACRQVEVKLVSVEADQLPLDFKTTFQRHMRLCMPGMDISGVVLRHGCLLISMDLYDRPTRAGNRPRVTPLSPTRLLGRVAGAVEAGGEPLTDGSVAYCQLPDGTSMVGTWDAASSEFRHVDAGVLPASVLQLRQQGALCSLQLLGPHVQCVPLTSGMQTTLPLRITAPCNSRLMGWQPRGAAVSAEDTALRLHAEGSDTENTIPAALDVIVLVCRPNHEFLPVTPSHCGTGGTARTEGKSVTVTVQATLTLDTYEPCGLRVELWVKGVRDTVEGRSPPELLCASFPLVVLPSHWEAAATELQAHVATLGSVKTSTPLCDTTAPEPAQAAADATADPATDLLTDIAMWLSLDVEGSGADMHTARLSEDLGRTLVYYTVRWGMVKVSQLLTTTMAGRALAAGTRSTVVGWFARLASQVPSREDTGGHTSERGGLSEWETDNTPAPLIHVACYSGSPDMLEKVLRWGLVYGGGVWRWPWALEDKRGRTPLHLIAARSDPTVCIPMLETLRRMLTLRDLQAAYIVWSECTGGVNVTPAQCFAHINPGLVSEVQRVWADVPSTKQTNSDRFSAPSQAAAASSSHTPTSHLARSQVAQLEVGTSGASPSHASPMRAVTTTTRRQRPNGVPYGEGTWLQIAKDLWRWKQPAEYKAWAKAQLSGTVVSWAWCLATLGTMCMVRSFMMGALRYEWTHFTLHMLPYYTFVGLALCQRFVGTWQVLMPAVPVLHTLGYLYDALADHAKLPTMTSNTRVWTDIVSALMVAAFEQNSLPYTVIARTFLSLTHGLALHSARVSSSYTYAFLVQCACVLVCALVRTYQLRACRRWRLSGAHSKICRNVPYADAQDTVSNSESCETQRLADKQDGIIRITGVKADLASTQGPCVRSEDGKKNQ